MSKASVPPSVKCSREVRASFHWKVGLLGFGKFDL
jgi:hypothetical protein